MHRGTGRDHHTTGLDGPSLSQNTNNKRMKGVRGRQPGAVTSSSLDSSELVVGELERKRDAKIA